MEDNKKCTTIWLRPSVIRRMDAWLEEANCRSRSEFIEKAADDPIAYGDQFKEILDEQTALKELRATILAENKKHAEADRRIRDAAGMLENAVPHIAEWDESAIRQLVAQVKVLSKNEISVTLKSGIEIRQSISN